MEKGKRKAREIGKGEGSLRRGNGKTKEEVVHRGDPPVLVNFYGA